MKNSTTPTSSMNSQTTSQRSSTTFSKTLKSYIPVFAFVLGVYLILTFVIQIAYIPSASMSPRVEPGSFVLANRIADVNKGDVIIFTKSGVQLCKRIVGEEGDRIEVKDGDFYVNGKREKHGYGKTESKTKEFTVPEGKIFVAGDNRENSNDSRVWKEPYVDKKEIKAKVFYTTGGDL